MSLRLRILAGARSPTPARGAHAEDSAGVLAGPQKEQIREWAQVGPGEIRIGRHPANELELPYAGISAVHARLFQKSDGVGWWIEDLGSSNGTWVGNLRIPQGVPQSLRAGDEFRLGTVGFKLEGNALEWEPSSLSRTATARLESTATMGRRLIVDGLVPPAGNPSRPRASAKHRGPAGVHVADARRAASQPDATSSARGLVAPTMTEPTRERSWPARRIAIVGFAAGMTVLAISGLIALALAMR